MKKGLIGATLFLILGYFGISTFFASKAEEQFKKSVKVFDQALQEKLLQIPVSPRVNLLVKEYSKGLISSSAKLRVNVNLSDMLIPLPISTNKMSYDLDFKIHHGPFVLALGEPGIGYVEASAKLPNKAIEMAKKQLSEDSSFPQLDFSLLLNFDHSSVFKLSIPTFNLVPKQFPGKLVWNGMDMTYRLSNNFDNVQGASVIKGLELTSPFANAKVAKIALLSDLNATEYGLWVGTGSFDVPEISVSAQGQSVFELSKFKANSSANIHDGLLDTSIHMSLQSVQSLGQSFGPVNVDFLVKNLDAKASVTLQGLLQQFNEVNKLSKDKVEALTQQLDTLFPSALSRGAELSLSNVHFKMPQGVLSGALDIQLPAGLKAKKSMDLVDYVKAKGYLKVPMVLLEEQLTKQASRNINYQQKQLKIKKDQTLAANDNHETDTAPDLKAVKLLSRLEINTLAKEKVNKQVKKLTDNQLLIKEGDSYLFKFTFNKGHLFINDKPFSPEMLEQ